LQNQKEPTECLISEIKNSLNEQLYDTTEELNEIITIGQDNIHDGQDFLPTDVSVGNLEISLQSSLTESFPEIQGKTSPKVSDDKEIEKIATSKNDLQNFGKKGVTEFRKYIQNLQREFNRLCSLISDLLDMLQPKSVPNLVNQMQIKKIST